MENYRVKESDASIIKIELNSQGDYAAVSTDDPTLFDRFAAGCKQIAELAEAMPVKLGEIEKQYKGKTDFTAIMEKTLSMSGINVEFSQKAVDIVDNILGEGTVKKYFHSIYEEIPDFLPDANCFIAFLEEITPIMEKLFGRKMEQQQKASKARMEKYQPQDYRKSGTKK